MCENKMSSGSFKILSKNVFRNPIFNIYKYKKNLVLNNLQWLICHKTKSNQTMFVSICYLEDI